MIYWPIIYRNISHRHWHVENYIGKVPTTVTTVTVLFEILSKAELDLCKTVHYVTVGGLNQMQIDNFTVTASKNNEN